jgi:hypothetical protein
MNRIFTIATLLFALAVPAYADDAPSANVAQIAKAPAEAALDQASLDDKAVKEWAVKAASGAMTFGSKSFQQDFEGSAHYFTKTGWESFSGQLQRSHRFDEMRKSGQTITASASGPAVIDSQGAQDGKYQWVVKLPLSLNEATEEDTKQETIQVRMVIVRVPASESPDGVAISEWSAL